MSETNINDLLKNSQSAKTKVATPEVEEKLKEKEAELLVMEKEKETEREALLNNLGYINLSGFPVSTEALKLIDQETAAKEKIICFFYNGIEIRLATPDLSNQKNTEILNNLAKKFHVNGGLYLVSQKSFSAALKLYERLPKFKEIKTGLQITKEEIDRWQKEATSLEDFRNKIGKTTVSDILTFIIASALKENASDIHLEAEENEIKIRFRLDGVLNVIGTLPQTIWPRVVNRVKLVAGLKINIENIPQDGHFSVVLDNDHLEVRVSTIPSNYGENIVIRLLRSSQTGLRFEDLGLRGRAFLDLEKEIKRPNGMIITTGPTGSGKTTTLYAILNKLNTADSKIITLENPIEYKLPGITQSQIDPEKKYTFAKGLKAILRQDPDIIMVGEIRDLETAETAINAALTGHLVVSTLHTNDAAGALPRLLAMGVKPFLLAPAINAVIGQRLVRKICSHCKTEDQLTPEALEKVLKILNEIPEASGEKISEEELKKIKFYKGAGCEACHQTGYKGRIGVYEIFAMEEKIEKIILSEKVSEYEMRRLTVENGMVTMVQDGLLKAKDGITTVEEVFRVSE
jgi:type II secretory ATPase GspE/PulE/Tfp pilus assembly ATPase PilB-like protein